jgi:hypothetical protein
MNLLEEIKADYDFCMNLFFLKGRQRLKGDNCPVYVIGKYESSSLVMFGINPGYSPKNNPTEDMDARKSWESYQNLYLNFSVISLIINLNHLIIQP